MLSQLFILLLTSTFTTKKNGFYECNRGRFYETRCSKVTSGIFVNICHFNGACARHVTSTMTFFGSTIFVGYAKPYQRRCIYKHCCRGS